MANTVTDGFTHADYDGLCHLVSPAKLDVHRYPKHDSGRSAVSYVPSSKKHFENYAFNQLYEHRGALGINDLFRCKNARTDGFLRLDRADSEPNVVLLELKTSLSWASLNAAMGVMPFS